MYELGYACDNKMQSTLLNELRKDGYVIDKSVKTHALSPSQWTITIKGKRFLTSVSNQLSCIIAKQL